MLFKSRVSEDLSTDAQGNDLYAEVKRQGRYRYVNLDRYKLALLLTDVCFAVTRRRKREPAYRPP